MGSPDQRQESVQDWKHLKVKDLRVWVFFLTLHCIPNFSCWCFPVVQGCVPGRLRSLSQLSSKVLLFSKARRLICLFGSHHSAGSTCLCSNLHRLLRAELKRSKDTFPEQQPPLQLCKAFALIKQ